MKSKSSPEQSVLMGKWSSKPADHNAIRVRNNQRRHRARVKSRVEDLEKRLEETSAKLETALSTISGLTAELEVLRRHHQPQPPQSQSWRHCTVSESPVPELGSASPQLAGPNILQLASSRPTIVAGQPSLPPSEPDSSLQVYENVGSTSQDDGSDCNNCQNLPPPAPGESTMPCSSAFQIIEQQNVNGVEVTAIRAWLGPAFRKALQFGEACRVETNRLYELLDHITSSGSS